MTDVEREEEESGKFSRWVHVKNWISNYLKPTDLNIDGSKNVGVNVISITEEDPDAATKNNPIYSFAYDGNGRLQYIYLEITPTIWKRTLSYTSGRLVYITAWVEQ